MRLGCTCGTGALTCSRFISFAYLTCSRLIKLRLAYILCYFIRKLRYSFDFPSGFTRNEYHVIRVDFIVALRRTKGRGRRTLRSPPSPSSGLHLIHPGLSAAAGHYCCRGLYQFRYLVSGAAVYRQFRMLCSYLCSGWYRSRFSRFRWAYIVRFSLVVGRTVRACGYGMFCHVLSLGLPLTATFLPISLDASPFHQSCLVEECCKNAFVRLKLQENGYPIQAEPLTIQVIPHRLHNFPYSIGYYNTSFTYRYPPKQSTQSRSAQIQR